MSIALVPRLYEDLVKPAAAASPPSIKFPDSLPILVLPEKYQHLWLVKPLTSLFPGHWSSPLELTMLKIKQTSMSGTTAAKLLVPGLPFPDYTSPLTELQG